MTQISEIEKKFTNHNHDKYVITSEFNEFKVETFAARLVQANVVTKTNFDNKIERLSRKISSDKT